MLALNNIPACAIHLCSVGHYLHDKPQILFSMFCAKLFLYVSYLDNLLCGNIRGCYTLNSFHTFASYLHP